MNRNLSELSLKELEIIIDNYLHKFEGYTRIINPKGDHHKFLQHIANLRVTIKSKKANTLDCTADLSEILMYITTFYDNELLLKAKDFVISSIEMIQQKDATVFSAINDKTEKIKNIMNSNIEIRNKSIKTVTDVEAALLLHARETESMQYPLIQAVKNCLPSNIDLYNLLSIIGKVKNDRRPDGYVTDSTAMKECISHDKCEIRVNKLIFDCLN